MYYTQFLNSHIKSISLVVSAPIYLFSSSQLTNYAAARTNYTGFLALPLYMSAGVSTPTNLYNTVRPGTSFLLTSNVNYTSLIASEGVGMDTAFLKPSYSSANSLNFYKFKNINIDLYFTKNLLSNLNSSKQVRWLTRFA